MSAGDEGAFVDRLTATLTLTIGAASFAVVAGDLKRFALTVTPFGFSGSAEFWFVAVAEQSEDELFTKFVERDVIEVSLTAARTFDEVAEAASPMTLKGLVTARSVVERAFPDVAGQPVLQRRYAIQFADRAAVLWREHRPTALYVDKSLKELVQANTPAGVTVECPWSAASTSRPVLALGLGVDGNDASFYDFLFWLLHKENAALIYDSPGDTYEIVSTKPSDGEVEELARELVASVEVRFPEVRRDVVSVLNAFTDAAVRKKSVTNDDAADGVRTDYLIRTSIADRLDAREATEKARAEQRRPELRVLLSAFPTTPLLPSMKVKLGEGFSDKLYASGKTHRVVSARITAEALRTDATDDNGEEDNAYRLVYDLSLELDADPVFRYAAFRRPVWPFYVEGKVLSETGEQSQGTYQIYQEGDTSMDVYKVKVPLWDDQKVIVPFDPCFMSGHFYFPAYRDERVLIELEFDRARICAFLDWRPGARLPIDTQGNHILVGKGAKDETSIRHVYADAKPELTIQRSMGADLQVISISEGTIKLETREEQ